MCQVRTRVTAKLPLARTPPTRLTPSSTSIERIPALQAEAYRHSQTNVSLQCHTPAVCQFPYTLSQHTLSVECDRKAASMPPHNGHCLGCVRWDNSLHHQMSLFLRFLYVHHFSRQAEREASFTQKLRTVVASNSTLRSLVPITSHPPIHSTAKTK